MYKILSRLIKYFTTVLGNNTIEVFQRLLSRHIVTVIFYGHELSEWLDRSYVAVKQTSCSLRLVLVVKSLCKPHKILKTPLETYFQHILQKLCLILSRKGKKNSVYLPKYVLDERPHGKVSLTSLGFLLHIPNCFEDAIFIDYFVKSWVLMNIL